MRQQTGSGAAGSSVPLSEQQFVVYQLTRSVIMQVAAHPDFYDTRRMGCEIPSTGFAGHGAPEADPAVRPPRLTLAVEHCFCCD